MIAKNAFPLAPESGFQVPSLPPPQTGGVVRGAEFGQKWRMKWMRWLWVFVLGLAFAGENSPLRAAAVTNLTVMSFNIWVSGGLSLDSCIEVIRRANADLVGLQECNAKTAQTIGTRLGY